MGPRADKSVVFSGVITKYVGFHAVTPHLGAERLGACKVPDLGGDHASCGCEAPRWGLLSDGPNNTLLDSYPNLQPMAFKSAFIH